MKKILLALLVLALIGGIYGYYEYNRPVSSLATKAADLTISSSDLINAYTTDENAANTKYNDKLIIVSGIVDKTENVDGKNAIYLKSDNPMSAVICEFENGFDISNIKPDQNVSIKGRPTGILSDVVLVQCVLNN